MHVCPLSRVCAALSVRRNLRTNDASAAIKVMQKGYTESWAMMHYLSLIPQRLGKKNPQLPGSVFLDKSCEEMITWACSVWTFLIIWSKICCTIKTGTIRETLWMLKTFLVRSYNVTLMSLDSLIHLQTSQLTVYYLVVCTDNNKSKTDGGELSSFHDKQHQRNLTCACLDLKGTGNG